MLASLLLAPALLTAEKAPPSDRESLVQLAILLDTSNSMDGLIEQAKSQLWKIVNEFNGARRDGLMPAVQVALYEYGNNRLSVGTNYIRLVQPFTRDLDLIADELFKLTTNGGDEYCGAVIRQALDELQWDARPGTYKAVFIAGNEPFTQGPVDANTSCREAERRGVVVNSIHCGSTEEGERGGWRTGAALAGGRFFCINQDKAIVRLEAPQDKEITDLGVKMNATYLGFGKDGAARAQSQVAQDSNAEKYKTAGAAVERSLTKSSANYDNRAWDLVDACRRDGLKLESVKEADLPPQMRALPPEKRQAYLDEKATEREKLQQRIQELNREREAWLAAQQKEKGATDTLDAAIAAAVREQAGRLAFEFKN